MPDPVDRSRLTALAEKAALPGDYHWAAQREVIAAVPALLVELADREAEAVTYKAMAVKAETDTQREWERANAAEVRASIAKAALAHVHTLAVPMLGNLVQRVGSHAPVTENMRDIVNALAAALVVGDETPTKDEHAMTRRYLERLIETASPTVQRAAQQVLDEELSAAAGLVGEPEQPKANRCKHGKTKRHALYAADPATGDLQWCPGPAAETPDEQR